ncbi:MAG: error-prone DNA polymerase, partial [Proteobacteria bacterium]|nr:error-prone DNA polymerase [Pseudomonadota bacterium]
HHLYRGGDGVRIDRLAKLAKIAGLPLAATNDVLYHQPERRPLQDVLTCARKHCTIHDAGRRLQPNAERHLKAPEEMARLFRGHPEAIERTLEIAGRCTFSLDELRYEYPAEPVPEGLNPQEGLVRLTWEHAAGRYTGGVPEKVRELLERELALIAELGYAPYFLTVYDLVRFAKSRGILCQGRGSAANSAVCYVLGITAVDPEKIDLLFERFVSAERDEPPDIDVDFEHERREEVIQYIYGKYGRERAGIAATVIRYRSKSAIRDVGKALGLSLDTVDALSRTTWGGGGEGIDEKLIREVGFDPEDHTLKLALRLSRELIGFPRHLSQHVGGFVISRERLDELVPIENAAMEERTVIEWDKDDLDALGLLKIDVLALGMLTCIHKAFELVEHHYGRGLDLATVPADDPAVYDMLCEGDSIGVFQVESRAQMSMLPRLKPRTFYDLVIEVAIVRPGPIQGDMVHPYLRRREGKEEAHYPSEEIREVLGRTLGVPLFQEQAMRLAMTAGFSPAEADQLRRSMATFRMNGSVYQFADRFVSGMIERGYSRECAEFYFKRIEGFGGYGFPESHSASFALLVYVSAWLKCHYPAAFACALLNSQPMGFYAPAQIVRDAQEHGVEVRPVDANHSEWDCTLEPLPGGRRALRLGFRRIKGFGENNALRLVAARGEGYPTLHALWLRSGLSCSALETLANADTFGSLGLDRRAALWQIQRLGDKPLPLFSEASTKFGQNAPPPDLVNEPEVFLPEMSLGEHVIEDYRHLTLSLRAHPLALLRERFTKEGITPNAKLAELANDSRVMVAGLVLVLQQPGTAKGVIFATLEDETGHANIIVWPNVFARYRRIILGSRLLGISGRLQREGQVIHVVADHPTDLSARLQLLTEQEDPSKRAPAHVGHVKHPGRDSWHAMPKGREFR